MLDHKRKGEIKNFSQNIVEDWNKVELIGSHVSAK